MISDLFRFMIKRKAISIACILLAYTLASCSASAGKLLFSPRALKDTQSAQGSSGSNSLRALEYYSPLAGANYVSKADSIILRYGPVLTLDDIFHLKITVQGSQSGSHTGKTTLADDYRTVVYKPDQPFTPGEQVQVRVNGLSLNSGAIYQPLDYTFSVAINQQAGAVASVAVPTSTPVSAIPMALTAPQDIPHYTVSVNSPSTVGEGDIFVAPFYWGGSTVGSYLLILDNNGQVVYYKPVGDQLSGFDFKVLPGGYLTYYDQKDSVHVIMNSQYQVVGTYPAENGYTADLHDFIMTPDGYVFLMGYDTQTIDMSKIVTGGNPSAQVTGVVIQELDPSQNVIFEWRSWDHFAFSDSNINLTTQVIDLVHGNGIALTNDGSLLLSSRNLNEITEISLQTGSIIWRLGGKNSTFTFVNDGGFAYQHDIAVLPNGDITLFDNHGTDPAPAASRALEYKLDLTNKTATLVWEFVHNPPVFSDYTGSVERLPDGNTLIGWGDAATAQGYVFSSITEVTPDNRVVFELTFDKPYVSYRAFRIPWAGTPAMKPVLAFNQSEDGLTLGYSWNGATEVASWKLYGGDSAQSMSLINQETKTGFETQTYLPFLPSKECYFQVAALDKNGNELAWSGTISINPTKCPTGP